jgi:hypothetical protein
MRSPGPILTGFATFGALACGLVFSATPALATPPEKPVTEEATLVTGSTATLKGELNPKVTATTGYDFTYNTNGTCTPGTTTTPGAEAKGTKLKVSTPVTGLEPSKKYTFCVVATNAAKEETPGSPLEFTTLGVKPVVGVESASPVSPFEETLAAKVNSENQATSYSFEYSTEATGEVLKGSIKTVPGAEPLPAEFGELLASVSTGRALTSATTYFYRVVATNGTGTTKGKVESFTTNTAEKPIVASESVSGLTATDAKLEAKVNPNWQETTYAVEYATNEALTGATTVPGAAPLTAAFEEQLAGPVDLGGALTPGKSYFYRIAAKNETGETKGVVQSFQALATPAVTTGEAQSLTRTSATVSGTVNPGGAATTYHFAYIEQAGYEAAVAEKAANPYTKGGRTTSESSSVGSDYAVHAVGPLQVTELHPGVTYHYAVVATNSVGTTIDPIGAMFTTSALTPPIAVTGEAVGVTQLSATLTGAVNTQGLQTAVQFEFGTTPGAGFLVPATVVPGSESGSTVGISDAFSGSLQQGITYYYRIVATNSDGTSYGAERSFTTGSFPGLPAVTPAQLIAWPPFVAALSERAAREAREGTNPGPPTKPLTKSQKLAKVLKACTKKPKKQRSSCRRQAKRRYR